MSAEQRPVAELKALLGDKYRPNTHDYLLSNRRSAFAKQLEGWTSVSEYLNHGEHMIVLERVRSTADKPSLLQRAAAAIRGI